MYVGSEHPDFPWVQTFDFAYSTKLTDASGIMTETAVSWMKK